MSIAFRAVTLLCIAWGMLGVSNANAQPATTVQLPTFQFFTVSTSVLVPDRGSTVIGGNRTGSLGSNFYSNPYLGLVRTSSTGNVTSQMQLHAQVHDLREMDAALLSQTGGGARPPLLYATNPQVSSAELPPAGSVADAARARQAELAAADREARGYYEQGLQAESAGRPSLARAYYQMASGKANESFKLEIRRRLASLPDPANASRTARKPQP
jgi:hypothetical protein